MQRDPYGRPLSLWRKLVRAEGALEHYVSAVFGLPCTIIGAVMLLTGDGDRWSIGIGAVVLIGGLAMIYETLCLLGLIGRRE